MKWILRFILAGVFLAAIGTFLLTRKFNPETIKPKVEKSLSTAFQAPTTIETIEWRWFPHPYFSASGIDIKREQGPTLLISEIRVKANLRGILKRKIVFDEVEVYQPTISLIRDSKGRFLTPYKSKWTPHEEAGHEKDTDPFFTVNLNSVKFTEARLHILASTSTQPSQTTKITADGEIFFLSSTTVRPIELRAQIVHPAGQANATIKGIVGSEIDVVLTSKKAPVGCLSEIFPFLDRYSGYADVSGRYTAIDSLVTWEIHGSGYDLKIKNDDNSPIANGKFSVSSDTPWNFTLNVESENTKGNAHIVLPMSEKLPVQMRMSGDPIQWADVVSWSKLIKQNRAGSPPRQRTIDIEADLKNIRFDTGVIEKVAVYAVKKGTAVHLNHLDVKIFDGQGTLTGDITDKTFDLHWSGTSIDVVQLQNFFRLKNRISGLANSTGTLSGERNPFNASSANGSFKVQISSGALLGAPLMLKFISSLNMTSFLRHAEKAERKELPFETADATALIQNGVIVFEQPALLSNKTLQIALTGKVDFPRNHIQAQVIVNFLEVVSEIIGKIPGVRTAIMGGRKTLLPLFVNVQGPLENPKINVESIETISKSVLKTTESIFKFPFKLTKSILLPEKKSKETEGTP